MSEILLMKKPCKNCPFIKDTLKGWLGEERAKKIAETDSFVCHKTTGGSTEYRRQCAGFMLMQGSRSSFIRVAIALKIDLGLKGGGLVFNSAKEFIEHHTTH